MSHEHLGMRSTSNSIQPRQKAFDRAYEIERRVIGLLENQYSGATINHIGGLSPFDIEIVLMGCKRIKIEVKERRDYTYADIVEKGSVVVDHSKYSKIGNYVLISVFSCGKCVASHITDKTPVNEILSRKNNWTTEKVYKKLQFSRFTYIGDIEIP
jgi:hypothetical protein